MSDTTVTSPPRNPIAPAPDRFDRSTAPASQRIIRALGLVVTLVAAAVAIGSFWVMTGASNIEPDPQVWTAIWIVNAVLILLVVALVLTEVVVLVQARLNNEAGARLRTRLVTMFALVAAVPALIVAVFAAVTLNQGLDQWFSERTREIVESSRLIAQSYLQEHGQVLRDDVIWVATELETARETFGTDRARFQRILTALATTRSLPFTALVSGDGDALMRAQINVQGTQPTVPVSVLADVQEGVPFLLSPGNTNMVGALVKLRGYDDTYLFTARPVDAEVLEYMKLTDDNISDYRLYASNRVVFQVTFALMYIGLALVLLLAALWIGMALANRFVDPIRNLMIASNRVSQGRLDVRVPVREREGDLRDLSVRFNRMVGQLRSQRQALVDANDNNEKRRQFTEAVVEGVSAGVLGLDPYGIITLANQRASEMIGHDEIELMHQPLVEAVPQLAPIMERAQSARHGQIRDQIQLGAETDPRTYQVQLTREGTMTESKGFVLTLDDITDLMTAQRTSAWADVARRIAHEIKNPLTPIQLSAERLRKRYAKKLEGDFEVFDKCVETIIRQVGDIGRMVDEFSSFARMPSAALEHADIADAIRQAVFMESVRQPQIELHAEVPEGVMMAQFDTRLIAQALTNLIKNSVEAIEAEGFEDVDTPAITVSAVRQGDQIRIAVNDNGKGWPDENRQRLLEPYMTTRDKGTGLGLAIVAKIIEQHGGTVELLDAEPDARGRVGASFVFTLPTSIPANQDGQSESLEAPTESSAGLAPESNASDPIESDQSPSERHKVAAGK